MVIGRKQNPSFVKDRMRNPDSKKGQALHPLLLRQGHHLENHPLKCSGVNQNLNQNQSRNQRWSQNHNPFLLRYMTGSNRYDLVEVSL